MSAEPVAQDPVVETTEMQDDDTSIKNLTDAVPVVLKKALIHDGIVRGLHEVAKALEATKSADGKRVRVCFLALSCNETGYSNLVKALCKASNVPLVEVPDAKDLGQWAGLCKIDKEGQPRKVIGAGCVAITDYGEESAALDFLRSHISSKAAGAQA